MSFWCKIGWHDWIEVNTCSGCKYHTFTIPNDYWIYVDDKKHTLNKKYSDRVCKKCDKIELNLSKKIKSIKLKNKIKSLKYKRAKILVDKEIERSL